MPSFHIMTKPIGPVCNLDCRYCFYLDKLALYPETRVWRMPDEVLRSHQVAFNLLTTVHRGNSAVPLEVYRFLKQYGSGFLQFIPVVERAAEAITPRGMTLISPAAPEPARVTEWSVEPEQFGRQPRGEAAALIELAQRQQPALAAQPAAVEIRHDRLTGVERKRNLCFNTCCHCAGAPKPNPGSSENPAFMQVLEHPLLFCKQVR